MKKITEDMSDEQIKIIINSCKPGEFIEVETGGKDLKDTKFFRLTSDVPTQIILQTQNLENKLKTLYYLTLFIGTILLLFFLTKI